MSKSILQIVLGDLDEKSAYRKKMKRVKALPENYRTAFRKIQKYLYLHGEDGGNLAIFDDLIDLFETSAADGKDLSDVIGNDAAKFCDELILAANTNRKTRRDKLNQEIAEYFDRKGIEG
ncbi:MAG: DUF1048 domain-containing protein [Eubacterium sp.]|nr:DUF1048 domain-containing protein [Eubacterium sp.]